MNSPIISVIVPVYNVEDYLYRCLKSLQDQTFIEFEVLIIDDGSTDNCAQIAEKFTKNDERFIYQYQNNAGQGSARNRGLKMARGSYICFIDSDDYIHNMYLELLYNTLIETNSDIAVCGVERIFNNGRKVNYKITNRDGASEITDINKYMISASFSVCNKLFKKDLFRELEFPEKIKFEDFALMPRVYERAKKISTINNKLYYYFFRPNSTTVSTKINLDILKAQVILEKSSFGLRHPDLIKIYFIRQVMGSLLWAMSQNPSYKSQVNTIVEEAITKYPNLDSWICDEYIGEFKSIWGKLLFKRHYIIASLYVRFYEFIRVLRRKISFK